MFSHLLPWHLSLAILKLADSSLEQADLRDISQVGHD